MPDVTRTAANATTPEGFEVITESGGTQYKYILHVVTEDTVELAERYEREGNTAPWEESQGDITDAVADEMAEYGYEPA